MKLRLETLAAIVAAGTLAVAVPAAAHPGPGDHGAKGDHAGSSGQGANGDHSGRGNHGAGHSRKCEHRVGYVEGGTVDAKTASTLDKNADGTWSGTLVVDVTRANHWAHADKGKTVTYTFTAAHLKVRFAGGATGFKAGERIQLIGKLAVGAHGCTVSGAPAAPVFRMIVVHPASSTGSSTGSSSGSSSGAGGTSAS